MGITYKILRILCFLGCVVFFPLALRAENNVLAGQHGPVQVTLSERGVGIEAVDTLRIITKGGKAPSIFTLENPSRLVIDLPGLSVPSSKTFNAEASTYVKSLRIGGHPDKVRIVLDIKGDLLPEYTQSQKGGQVVIQFPMKTGAAHRVEQAPKPSFFETPAAQEAPGGMEETAPQEVVEEQPPPKRSAQKPTPLPTKTPLPTRTPRPTRTATPSPTRKVIPTRAPLLSATPTPTATALPSDTPTEVPQPAVSSPVSGPPPEIATAISVAVVPTAAAVEVPTFPPGMQVLKDLSFDYLDKGHVPIVRIVLAERAKFNLARKDDRSYRLTINDCAVASTRLMLPQFPPQDFIGFTVVSASAKQGNIEVIIGVERGVRLASFAKENEIWIRVLNQQ